MTKNVKSEDKERNQIQPRDARFTVSYDLYGQGSHSVSNANEQLKDTPNRSVFQRTYSNTRNLPRNTDPRGVLLGLKKEDNNQNPDGYQLYLDYNGRIAGRMLRNGTGDWKITATQEELHNRVESAKTELNSRIDSINSDQSVNLNNYLLKPEHNLIVNLNDANTSGVFKTDPSLTQGTWPQGITQEDKWGVVTCFYENSSNKTGYQLYVSCAGPKQGSIYTRTKKGDQSWREWREINLNVLSDVISHPTSLPPSNTINKLTPKGYYKTDSSTQGLPQGKAGDGFVKVVKHGNHGVVTYTHIADNKVYTASYDSLTRDPNLDWGKVGSTEGYTKIHNDNRNLPTPNPEQFREHSNIDTGFLVYQWKWASAVGLDNPKYGLSNNKDLIITTLTPNNRSIVADDLVSQIAYDIADHRYFWRKSRDSRGTQWSDWEEVSGKDSLKMDRPENVNVIYRADDVDHSGVFKTSNSNPSTENLPSQQDNKDGVLTHYIINYNNAIQYWISSVGSTKGTLYLRYKENGTWRNWQPLGTGGSTPITTQKGIDLVKFVTMKQTQNIPLSKWKEWNNKESDYPAFNEAYFDKNGINQGDIIIIKGKVSDRGNAKCHIIGTVEQVNQSVQVRCHTFSFINESTGGGSTITQSQVREWIKEEIKNIFTQFHTT